MDRMRALETFVAVADEGSFVGAARVLNISAPSVTRIIAELEDYLGVILLHRSTRALKLTDIGHRYLTDTQKLVSDFEAANASAKGAHHVPSGVLRVTAPTLFGQIHILPLLTEFLDLYPDVRLEGVFLDRNVNLLEEGLDVAIRIGNLPDSTLTATRVGHVRSMICGSPSYFDRHGIPQTPQDLPNHNLIMATYGNAPAEWRFANDFVLRLNPRLVFTSVPAAIEAAKSGWGLTRALSYQIGPDLQSGCLQTALSEYAPNLVPVHIVHGEARRSSAKIRAFVDLASDRLRSNRFIN